MKNTSSILLGIDLGAGSLKAILVTENGDVLGSASEPVTTHVPYPGWSEQDPVQWWSALCKSVKSAIAISGINPASIAAVSLTAGAHIQVLEDGKGNVLRKAILRNDAAQDPGRRTQ